MAKAITKEEFIFRTNQHYPNEKFEIIEYTTMSNPLQIQCLSCKKILHYPQAKNFLVKNKKYGCSDCAGIRAKSKNNIEQLEKKYEIIQIERRQNGALWYTCKCKNCGRISTHQIVSFLNNSCRCEGSGVHWTEAELKQYLLDEYNNEYTLLTPFKTVNDKSLFKHSCGFIWSTTPAHILYNNTGCPKCCKQQSKGCKIIEAQLQALQITYDKEHFLQNSLQRFDFYLEFQGQQYAIEYNGEQHYKYNPFFHGKDIKVFEKYQERDRRKAQYCKDNNIFLIVIPYTFTNNDIKAYINKLFSSSTTSFLNVASSEAK